MHKSNVVQNAIKSYVYDPSDVIMVSAWFNIAINITYMHAFAVYLWKTKCRTWVIVISICENYNVFL
jgi:hypothetical protein